MPSVLGAPIVVPAVVAALQGDSTLTSMLAASPDGGTGLYTSVRQTATRPYLLVTSGGEVPFNTMGGLDDPKWGGNVTVSVKAVSNDTDAIALAIIGRVKTVLDSQDLTVSGFGSVSCDWGHLYESYAELIGGQPVWHVPADVMVTVHQGDR